MLAVQAELIGATPKTIKIAENHLKLGNREAADTALRQAEITLRKLVQERPRDRYARVNLAYALALLGQRNEAVQLLGEALDAAPESEDVVEGRELALFSADVFGVLGDFDRACKMYRHLLEVPSVICRFTLRNDPFYDDFKKNPQFAALIAEPGP